MEGLFCNMTFDVTILGCGAATPTLRHNPSAQIVNLHDKLFLVDCGEGTQMALRRQKIKIQRIQHIFISHLHGDHYLGLIGLLSSLHLLGNKGELNLYGPPDLKPLLDLSFKVSETYLDYTINFFPTTDKEKQLLYEDKTLEVYSIPLKHRIECCGFQFCEKPKVPKVKKGVISKYDLQPSQIIELKHGNALKLENGETIDPIDACIPPDRSRKYSYCSDTMYWETLIPHIADSDLLYHESTFLDSELERAKHTFHSTARQAAKIARMANVKKLVLGHFSSRYHEEDQFIIEAKEEFENVDLADEGKTFSVDY